MGKSEIEKIKEYLNEDFIMLEYGSGGSTLYFPRFVKKYISIEHDKNWWQKAFYAKPDNCEVYWVRQNAPRTRPTKRREFKDYVEYVHCLGIDRFDAVLIDGRARVGCAIEVKDYIDENSVVFVHDFQRAEYKKILDHYEIIDKKETLVVLKKK